MLDNIELTLMYALGVATLLVAVFTLASKLTDNGQH